MTQRPLLRYILIGLGGLLAVLLALAAYVAATFDPNDYKDELAALVKRSKNRDLRFEGPIRLSFWPNLGADLSGVSLSEAGGGGTFLRVGKAHASVRVMPLLGGQVVVNGVDVSDVQASIRRDAQGAFNFADLLSKPEEKSEKVAFDIASIRVRNSRIDYADAGGSRLRIDGIDLQTGAISESTARDVRLAAQLTAPGQSTALQARFGQAAFGDTFAGRDVVVEATVDSKAADGSETRLKARASMATLDQKGQVLSTSPLQATMSGTLAGASVDLSAATPLRFDLAQNRLSLQDLALQFSAKQQLVDLNGTLKGPAELALASQTLRVPKFALDLTASSPKLAGGPVQASISGELGANAAARSADVRFEGHIDGHALGGTLGAEAAGTPSLRADLRAREVDIAKVIARFSSSDLLAGKGDVDIRVTTQGATAAALTQALNGDGAVVLRDGAVKGLDINSSIREMRSAVRKVLGKETGTTVKNKRTDFSEMTASFTIRDGVLDNRDLAMKSPLLRVAGAGTVDLVKAQLDYGVKASLVASREGQGGEERSQLAGITVPVKLYGPLAAPQYSIDFAAMLTPDVVQKALANPGAAKEAAKETVRDVKDQAKGVKDSVRDLKGLFGR